MTEELLPPSAQVRCRLATDVPMQIRLLIATSGLDNIDESNFIRQVINVRNRNVINRPQEILPEGEIDRISSNERLDIDSLGKRLPFVFAIWVYESALTIDQAAALVSDTAASSKAGQDSP